MITRYRTKGAVSARHKTHSPATNERVHVSTENSCAADGSRERPAWELSGLMVDPWSGEDGAGE